MNVEEFPPDTEVTKIGYELSYRGRVFRYENKYRQRWSVVLWSHHQFTCREYPHAIARVDSK